MEAVPDIVQLPDDEAEIEKDQQENRADLIFFGHIPGQKIEHHEHDAENAAVDIGQTLFEIGLNGAAHVPRHLAHGVQQP